MVKLINVRDILGNAGSIVNWERMMEEANQNKENEMLSSQQENMHPLLERGCYVYMKLPVCKSFFAWSHGSDATADWMSVCSERGHFRKYQLQILASPPNAINQVL
uniref:Uncharacterized protein n=1 Tax=Sphaerodactylus townsendi TaxID=933632 RepID=A0ACB8G553_9SAUR